MSSRTREKSANTAQHTPKFKATPSSSILKNNRQNITFLLATHKGLQRLMRRTLGIIKPQIFHRRKRRLDAEIVSVTPRVGDCGTKGDVGYIRFAVLLDHKIRLASLAWREGEEGLD